ncbi:MAG: 3-deoxy-7-phosphoheptulonate synthase [Dehalococcoidia bacterium]
MRSTSDVNVARTEPLMSPDDFDREIPLSQAAVDTVIRSRKAIRDILHGDDPRMLMIVGPCSIHDEASSLEYAERLAKLAKELEDRMVVVMRVYFEKPRTTVGWKGWLNDPHLDGSFDIQEGLRTARRLLLKVNEMGLSAGTEFLDPIVPQYLAGLISWAAIGARTTESQTHREMASGLSMPVGFKNGTTGDIDIAVAAMIAARSPHAFLGIDGDGRTCIVHTTGNADGHVILRGGINGPNYDEASVRAAQAKLGAAKLPERLLVDCSHANSQKDHNNQQIGFRNVIAQRAAGNTGLVGLMLESHLFPGSQPLGKDLSQLKYGVSITDACIGWDETESLLNEAAERVPAAAR